MHSKWFLVFFVLLLFSACSKNRVELLTDRADAYNRGIRWNSLTAASALIDQNVRKTLVIRLVREIGRNRIVDYSIIDVGLDEKKKNGSVLVEYSFFGYDQQLKYRQEAQSWAYSSKHKNWFLKDVRQLAPPSK